MLTVHADPRVETDLDELKENFLLEYVDHPWSTMKAIPNTTTAQQQG